MQATPTRGATVLGFLTVVEHAAHGLFGGYLLLNDLGRPLEFHCTAPVRPSRAQEILYGATLKPYLYGEQIGRTLVGKAKARPRLILTDVPAMLAVRDFVPASVAWVAEAIDDGLASAEAEVPSPTGQEKVWRVDRQHATNSLHQWQVGRWRLGIEAQRRDDIAGIDSELSTLDARFLLNEPFERIRAALDEAQRGAR